MLASFARFVRKFITYHVRRVMLNLRFLEGFGLVMISAGGAVDGFVRD